MNIRVYSQKMLITLMQKEKKWFSNPEKIAFIRVSSSGLEDFPIDVPDENIIEFDFADIEEEEYIRNKEKLEKQADVLEENLGIRPRYSPITEEEAREIVEFVLKMQEKGVETLYIHCDEGKSRSPSLAYAIAKYVLADEKQADYYDVPFFHISETIVEKIKNASEGLKKRIKKIVEDLMKNHGRTTPFCRLMDLLRIVEKEGIKLIWAKKPFSIFDGNSFVGKIKNEDGQIVIRINENAMLNKP